MVAQVERPATIPYEQMSKADLIQLVETQKTIIQRFYRVLALSNEKAAPGEKAAYLIAQSLVSQEKPNADGLVRLPIGETAEQIGMSDSTTGRYFKSLCERYGATYELRPYTTKAGQHRNLAYINPTEPLWTTPLDAIPIADEKRRTINGNTCPRCGSSTYHVKKRVIASQDVASCDTCNLLHVFPVVQENEPLEPGTYVPADEGFQAGDLSESEKVDEAVMVEAHQAGDLSIDQEAKLQNLQHVYTVCSIPAELRNLPQWVCWCYGETNPITGRREKVPYDVSRPGRARLTASPTDPATWTTYERAQATYEASRREDWKRPYDGVGFAVRKENGLVVIDYDGCITDGQLSEAAQVRIQAIDSYAELSVSGTGVHQIARGQLSRNHGKKPVEMYDHAHYFTFTGLPLAATPLTIEERQSEIDALFAEVAPPEADRETARADTVYTSPAQDGQSSPAWKPLDDTTLLEKARKATNGAKFQTLYSGDFSGYPSQSEADLALCQMLAYWADGCAQAIDRLFRESGLYRPKWERNAGAGITYGEKTIRRVLRSYQGGV